MSGNRNNRDIVVIGSANSDMVAFTDRFPAAGETRIGSRFLMNAGGKGANQAVAASRAGGRVAFVGRVGDDPPGKEMLRNLQNEGIDTGALHVDGENQSGVAVIYVDRKGENTIVIVPGANMALNEAQIDLAAPIIRKAGFIIMQLEIPIDSILHASRIATGGGGRVILNPAPAGELPEELYPLIDIITPNSGEAELLTGIRVDDAKSASKAAGILIDRGVRRVVITMGADGAFVSSQKIDEMIPAPAVRAIDTTAAGDCFNGTLAVALARGDSLADAVRFANRAAALSTTRAGAQDSLPRKAEIDG